MQWASCVLPCAAIPSQDFSPFDSQNHTTSAVSHALPQSAGGFIGPGKMATDGHFRVSRSPGLISDPPVRLGSGSGAGLWCRNLAYGSRDHCGLEIKIRVFLGKLHGALRVLWSVDSLEDYRK